MTRRNRIRFVAIASLVLSVVLAACGGGVHALEAGSMYSVSMGEKGYQVAKVLVVDDESVHVRVYKNRFSERPSEIRADELSIGSVGDADGFGMGHLPLTRAAFLDCKPVFIETGSIAEGELDGYEMWKSGGGGLFGKR